MATDASTAPASQRLAELVEANIVAVHAYQIILAGKSPKAYPCYRAPDAANLGALVAHQQSLLNTNVATLKAWLAGERSAFDRAADLDPLLSAKLPMDDSLPVNVFTSYLLAHTKASRLEARAVANLYQLILEVDRDGDVFQQLLKFHIAIGLPVYVGQLGLPGSDQELLDSGKDLQTRTCKSPFATDAAHWQIAGRKIWNWAEKHLRIRDADTLATEMMQERNVMELLPKVRTLSPRKIAIIGHSFTITNHWSTPGSFTQIVISILGRLNHGVQFRHWFQGGLAAPRAKDLFLAEAIAWKPDLAFTFVLAATAEELAALADMDKQFKSAGARMYAFLHNGPGTYNNVSTLRRYAQEHGLRLADFDDTVRAAPDKADFLCLDKIHMAESYHRLMAREFLRFLVQTD